MLSGKEQLIVLKRILFVICVTNLWQILRDIIVSMPQSNDTIRYAVYAINHFKCIPECVDLRYIIQS